MAGESDFGAYGAPSAAPSPSSLSVPGDSGALVVPCAAAPDDVFEDALCSLGSRVGDGFCGDTRLSFAFGRAMHTQPLTIDSLPEEILVAIFSELSYRELAQAARVCRAWRTISADNSLWRALYKRRFFSRKVQRQPTQGSVIDLTWKSLFVKMYKRQRALPNNEIKVENHRAFMCLSPVANLMLCSPGNIAGLSRWLLVERCSEGGLNENNSADFCVLQRQLSTGPITLINRNTQHTVVAFHRVCNAVFCTLSWWIMLVPLAALAVSRALDRLHALLPMSCGDACAADDAALALSHTFGPEDSLPFQAALLLTGIACWYGHVSRQMLAERVSWLHLGATTTVAFAITRVLAQFSPLMMSDSIVFILMFCSSMANVVFKHRLLNVQYPNVETALCLQFLVGMLTLSGAGAHNIRGALQGLTGVTVGTDVCGAHTPACVFARNVAVSGWGQHVGNLVLLVVLDRFAAYVPNSLIVAFSIATAAGYLTGRALGGAAAALAFAMAYPLAVRAIAVAVGRSRRRQHMPPHMTPRNLALVACMGLSFAAGFATLEMDVPTFLVEFAVLFLFRYSCTNLYVVVNNRDQLTDLANLSYYGLLFGILYVVGASFVAVLLPVAAIVLS